MKLGEFGVGIITKQNATKDSPIGSEYSNVKKLGLGSGKPKIHNKKATKNSDPNTLFNLGIGEGKRIPRKKGQKANSKKHSDLYTDENPKGTIQGLKFATVKDAEASVRKIKSSGKKHAHKIQAAIAMEQRAKAAGKVSAAAVYRKYINAMKKKTKKMNESVDMSSLKQFVKFCIKSLELKSIPKIIITKKKLDGTFGYYNTATKTLTVSLNDRHEADVMRTLAHELVHLAQDEQNQDIDGSDGSKHENQANAVAGVIMRKWADKDPSLFETSVQELKIEKPDPKDTLGVKRKEMPQVKSDDYAEFIEYLKKNGATFTKETIPARDLKAMQKEFSDEGIMKQLMKNIEQGPNRKAVIASSDDYIMDGHHRWLVAINTGRDLNVFRVNLPAYELYDLVNKFEKTYYKDIYNERGSIGIPLASGLVMTLFPHRPLKIKKSTPGKLRYDETITTIDLEQLETFADKLFAKVGIDVEFTRHFLDRVNDERNRKPITMAELTRLFKQEFKRWAKPIAQMGPGQEAVMKDLQTDINLPFALQYDKDNNELDLIAKTVMRKKDFKTPNREFPVEGWSAKYKKSINCSNPKGFSQKAHCAGKKKTEEAPPGREDQVRKLKKKFDDPGAPYAIAWAQHNKHGKPTKEDDSKDTLGSLINFPGYEKKEKKPKYKPVPKKDKSILDKVKSWFNDNINEGYVLRLENDEDLLVLHIRNTRTGERAEVRGNPNYEIDYDENDELHQLLDVIGKASNISELMNGEIVSVNPKHPDGPKSYAALDNAMNEDDASDKVYELLLDNIGAGPFDGGCVVVAQALQLIHGGELMALVRNDGTADHAVVQKGNTMYDFDGPGTQEEVVSRFEKNEGTRIEEVRKLRMTDLPDAPRNSELAKQIASLMKEPVQEAQVDEGVNDPHIFKAVFLAGGPGSGKSFVAKNILGGTGLRSIDSDEVYEFLMKKQGLSLDSETIFSPQGQEIRDKAKGLSRRREATYLDGRLGLIIDGTGKDISKYQIMAQKLRAIGYDLSMIYVNTSLEVAQQRNAQRERSIKPAEVEKMWNNVQQNLMQFQQIFGAGRFHIIDNSGGLEDLDRQKNFDKVYVETQRFLNTPPKNRKALAWIQKQKEQNDGQRSAQQPTNQEPDGGTTATN